MPTRPSANRLDERCACRSTAFYTLAHGLCCASVPPCETVSLHAAQWNVVHSGPKVASQSAIAHPASATALLCLLSGGTVCSLPQPTETSGVGGSGEAESEGGRKGREGGRSEAESEAESGAATDD